MLLCERKAIPRERSWHFEINHDGYCWHNRQDAADPATGERDHLELVTTPSCSQNTSWTARSACWTTLAAATSIPGV